jgi:hypothetical protein
MTKHSTSRHANVLHDRVGDAVTGGVALHGTSVLAPGRDTKPL